MKDLRADITWGLIEMSRVSLARRLPKSLDLPLDSLLYDYLDDALYDALHGSLTRGLANAVCAEFVE